MKPASLPRSISHVLDYPTTVRTMEVCEKVCVVILPSTRAEHIWALIFRLSMISFCQTFSQDLPWNSQTTYWPSNLDESIWCKNLPFRGYGPRPRRLETYSRSFPFLSKNDAILMRVRIVSHKLLRITFIFCIVKQLLIVHISANKMQVFLKFGLGIHLVYETSSWRPSWEIRTGTVRAVKN